MAWFTYNVASARDSRKEEAEFFLLLLYTPIWIGLCALAAYSGQELGGKWRIVGWLPALLGFFIYAGLFTH
ncbi:MAG: hypothetical protein U0836_08440 [Pirellulales bacterium]